MKEVNGKIKFTTSTYLKLIFIAVTLIVSGTVAWTLAKGGISANAAEIAEASKERRDIKFETKKQSKDISILQNDVGHIKEDVGQIQEITQETRDLVQRIAGSMGVD